MADLVFQQLQRSFYIPADNDAQTARAGYLLPADEPNPPATIALAEALKQSGFFVFVPALPQGAALGTFIDTARRYLDDQAPAGTRFAWFPDPAAQGGDFSGTALQVKADGGRYVTAESVFIAAAPNVMLRIDGGDEITLDGDGALLFTPPSGAANALYVTPQGSPEPQILPLATPLRLALLGEGATNGCFGFQVAIAGEWLNYLDIGMRLFYKDAYWGTTDSFRYPLFSEDDPSFTLYATFDPLAPLEAGRSFFAFIDPAAPGAGPALTTYYRTNLGHAVALTPADAEARLIFAAKSTPSPTLYLAPSGDFRAGPASAGAQATASEPSSLMCGLSGVEYIRLETDGNGQPLTTISFTAGQPAFAKGFSPGGQPDKIALTGDMTTSWAYVHRPATESEPGTVVYYAQPDGSVLYKHNDQSAASDSDGPPDPVEVVKNALVYMEVPSIYLPNIAAARAAALSANAAPVFPMLPYGNAQGDAQAIGQLEFELVNPTRKAAINIIARSAPAPAPAWLAATLDDTPQLGVTPQGLLATYTPDYTTLVNVALAQTEPSPGQPSDNRLLLQSIDRGTDLWNALQSNQLFLVVTDPAALKDHMSGIIRVQGWDFRLTPDNWRPDTVLIFKFFNGKTLRDLAQNTGAWTLPDQFNKNVPDALATLAKAIQYASSQCCGQDQPDCLQTGQCPGAADFTYFIYSVLLNPLWNGILALNVGIPLTDLPDQLKSLAAGLDTSLFFAHHVGINASPVNYNPVTKQFDPQRSSIFGLINYDDPALLAATVDYSFKVLTLKVLFQNSAIADFASRVDLQVNRLFGDQVQLKGGSNNNLIFNGVYQDHDGKPAYVFTNQATNLFEAIANPVLNSVTLSEGQFITLTQQAGSTQVKSRFVFWGSVDFLALKGFDAFSFGSDEQTQGQLAFSNVAITMDFDQARPQQQTFAFDTSHLAYDLARSQARPTSLYSHFPLKLTAFLDSSIGTMPTDQGFMSVSSPLTQGTLVNPWYGLQFELELGSPGALAEQAGFVADLLVAWSPARGGDYNIFVGLKLPGSSGNKREISLQGLLKIRLKNIQFSAVPGKDKDGKDIVSYMLRLQTITLSFMSLSLPPSGRIDFLLFGDPNATGDNRTLGWYAVFDKGVKPRPKKPTPIPGFSENGQG